MREGRVTGRPCWLATYGASDLPTVARNGARVWATRRLQSWIHFNSSEITGWTPGQPSETARSAAAISNLFVGTTPACFTRRIYCSDADQEEICAWHPAATRHARKPI